MNKEFKKLLWIGLVVVVIIGGGIWAYNASQKPVQPTVDPKLLTTADSHTTETGTRTYAVTIVEFGDYQCPACAYAEPIMEKILKDNPQVKLVFRNFPLPMHEFSDLAAEAAEAAGAQGKFWEMHNAIYANQEIWVKMSTPLDAFAEMAKQLNLDVEKFKQDVQNKKFADRINKDRQDGIALGVQGTPSLFINGRQYIGGLDVNLIQLAIDQAQQESSTQQTAPATK